MTFSSDDIRWKFHLLPTKVQKDYCDLEEAQSHLGRSLHVSDVLINANGELEILVRFGEKVVEIPETI